MCLIGGATVVAGVLGGAAAFGPDPAYTLNDEGDLIRPTDYRTWVYVGTPVTPNDMNNGKAAFPEHHNVYIDPVSYEHYKQTGTWREGTILVKELVSVGSKQAVSGNGYFQGEFIGLEATIKSARDFPHEPGNWAYFSFTNEEELGGHLKDVATAFPTASCNACHEVSGGDDFVFTQHYPVLRAVKGARTNPENARSRPTTLGMNNQPVLEEQNNFAQIPERDPRWQATAATPQQVPGTDVPTQTDALFKYLQSGEYRQWEAKETTSHPSRGPHTNYGRPVRVFLNDRLAASMTHDREEHPVGSTAIKEMFTPDGTLEGWAVEIKTHRTSDAGSGWFWYEITSVTESDAIVAAGNGVNGCTGCHARGGRDFVLTAWPLR